MSIPIDFVGLNTLIAKSISNKKNQIFDSIKPKYLNIPSPIENTNINYENAGVEFDLKNILGINYKSKHLVQNNNIKKTIGIIKNLTISFWLDLSSFNPTVNSVLSSGNISVNSLAYFVIYPPSSGGSHYGLAFVRQNNKLVLALFQAAPRGNTNSIKYYSDLELDLTPTDPVNLTISLNSLEENYMDKKINADRPQTMNFLSNIYLNGTKCKFTSVGSVPEWNPEQAIFFNGIYGSNSTYVDAELADSFRVGVISSFSDTPADAYSTYNVWNFSDTNRLDSSNSTTIYNIAIYDRYLHEKDVIYLYNLGKDFFHFKELINNSNIQFENLKKTFYILNKEFEEQNLNIKDTSNGVLNELIASFTGSVGEQAIFSAFMSNLHGPYGYSSFKQLRASQNWLMRAYNKDNTFSFVSEKGDTITVIKDGKILSNHKTKYGEIQNLTETPVSEQHKPLEMIATISDGFDDEKLSIKGTYSNETQFFKNKLINVETSREIENSETYEDLKALTDKETTPLKSLDKLTLKQSVFPKNIYTHSRNHRTRPSYSSKIWRDLRASRTELDLNNGFGFHIPSQSFWPLDAEEWFTSNDGNEVAFWGSTTNPFPGGSLHNNSYGGNGVLQNFYNMFTTSSFTTYTSKIDNYVSASCIYNRLHSIGDYSDLTGSTLNPAIRDKFTLNDLSQFGQPKKFQGTSFWDAGNKAGYYNSDGDFEIAPKKPFPDSYDEWVESFRGLGKGYSVVPEFRISDHVNHYLTNGFTSQKLDFLDVKGGNQNYANSSDQNFFKVYSTTDFLKNFEIVKKDFENKVTPTGITLRCKAIKKFLPYEGFYPCQRTVEIASEFYNSYAPFIEGSSSNNGLDSEYVSGSKYVAQNIITPLFAPGVLFNTIKSGIACDYPIMTKNYTTSSDGNSDSSGTPYNLFIDDIHSERIPFEALLEPEKFLSNKNIYSNEPEHRTPKVVSKWSGVGNNNYKLMINNFLSEVPDFFLENENFTTITSLPQGDPNFGNAEDGKVYCMRIKMFRTIEGQTSTEQSNNGITYQVPQDNIGNMEESFTMYSRPSAFGPPYQTTITSGSPLSLKNWSKFKFKDSIDFIYDTSNAINADITGSISSIGENYIHTPPYYHGEAWADIFFKPPSGAKKYTLAEVINNSSVEFCRHYVSSSAPSKNIEDRSLLINEQAMQIASSINIFSRGILQEDSKNLTINTELETKYRWIIQSKYETPTLNFNNYFLNPYVIGVESEPLTFRHGSMGQLNNLNIPIGMWHQYGRLPQRTDEGIFIQVTDVPSNWIEGAMLGNINNTGSLVDLCGFSTDPIRVGEIKNTKLIEEAVVAIPFINRNGFREFFKLNKEDVHRAINGIEESVGPTVFRLTQQLDKYVFPPQFDYKRNKDITPVAMYVFEFSHEFTKQDLADIWQNLPPKLGDVHETAEATISHALFAEEFLGTGADPKKTENGIERNIVSELTDLPSDIQWMVFKVKKRAKSNYFEKMFQRNESKDSDSNTNFTVDSTGKKSDVSFNWPYDFFSMVELIKLDAEVEFSNVDEERSKEEKKLVTKPYIFRED